MGRPSKSFSGRKFDNKLMRLLLDHCRAGGSDQLMKRLIQILVPASIVLSTFHAGVALADQFSVKCDQAGVDAFVTFDEQTKRVVAYSLLDGRITSAAAVLVGTISYMSVDKIDFDARQVYFRNAKAIRLTLNRQEGWMGPPQAMERKELRSRCESIPLRPVMDLWQLLDNAQ